jgi:hypothetical protein
MHKKFSISALALITVAGLSLSGCAHVKSAANTAREHVLLSPDQIAAPTGTSGLGVGLPAEQVLTPAVQKSVKALLSALDQPLSLTAPISVPTFVSLNPEIVSTNRFGSVLASEVSAALSADGYTIGPKPAASKAPAPSATIRGTYHQVGTTLTVKLEVESIAEKTAVATQYFTVPIDGAMRKLLDR